MTASEMSAHCAGVRNKSVSGSLSALEGNMYVEVNVYSSMSLDMESSVSTK